MQRQIRNLNKIALSAMVAVTFAGASGWAIWQTWTAWVAGAGWRTAAGFVVSVALLSLFSVAMQEATRAIAKRGYVRPVEAGSRFEKAVRLFVPLPDTHPSKYRRAIVPVTFDDGSRYDVDLGVLYFVLLDEANEPSLLRWQTVKRGMDKKAWAAYRLVLAQSGVVDIDGRGAYRLNCTPWSAIETVKRHFLS